MVQQSSWASALEKAAYEVFEMMLGTRLETLNGVASLRAADYTGMIGLAGDLCGVLSFRCSSESASRMAALMLGVGEVDCDASVRDGLGEICNMVAGSFKAQITGLADHCMLSVPTVVTGRDYHFYPLVDGERVQACLKFEGQPVLFTLDLHA